MTRADQWLNPFFKLFSRQSFAMIALDKCSTKWQFLLFQPNDNSYFLYRYLTGNMFTGTIPEWIYQRDTSSYVSFFLISVSGLWFLRFLFVIYFVSTQLKLLNILSINSPLKDRNDHQLQFTFIITFSTQELNRELQVSLIL